MQKAGTEVNVQAFCDKCATMSALQNLACNDFWN